MFEHQRPALVDPSEVGNWRWNSKPMCVVNVFEAELLEHLSWLEVWVDDASCDVFVELSQPLRHDFDDEGSKSTALEALVNLKGAKRSHLDSSWEKNV